MREHGLREIYDRIKGHCHFCGDPIKFGNRGWSATMDGHWEVDHVIQRHKGGEKTSKNCLPACTRCNRLRWHRTGKALRNLLLYGVIAVKETKGNSSIGKQLRRLKKARLKENIGRRSKRKKP